jgi:hypothetical protein
MNGKRALYTIVLLIRSYTIKKCPTQFLNRRYLTMTNISYHGEVVGSLLRPPYLLGARRQLEAGQLSPADFKAIEDRAVLELVVNVAKEVWGD